MVRHTSKTLQKMLQDFQSVSDQFETLHIKGLIHLGPLNPSFRKLIDSPCNVQL